VHRQQKARKRIKDPLRAVQWALRDLNKPGKHGENIASGQKLTQNPTHEMQSRIETRLIQAFRRLSPDEQNRLIEHAENVANQCRKSMSQINVVNQCRKSMS
jgi:peptide subunit release factor 1 (eRF1)